MYPIASCNAMIFSFEILPELTINLLHLALTGRGVHVCIGNHCTGGEGCHNTEGQTILEELGLLWQGKG